MTRRHHLQNFVIFHLLKELRVRFTRSHLRQLMDHEKNAGNILGASNILTIYNIENAVVRIDAKALRNVDVPFVALTNLGKDDLIVVSKVSDTSVEFIAGVDKRKEMPLDQFLSYWSGIVLIAAPTAETSEKAYPLNRIKEIASLFRLPVTISVFLTMLATFVVTNSKVIPVTVFSYFLLNVLWLAGVLVSVFLLARTVGISNRMIDRICSLAGEGGDCNNVLESKAAKIFGMVSWSEIGLVYFLGGELSLAVAPQSMPLLFWINILALPYTVWSVYYQWKVARQWCVLCLAVQAILWLCFVSFVLANTSLVMDWHLLPALAKAALCFAVPAVILWAVMPVIERAALLNTSIRELNGIKTNEEIFNATLVTQQKVDHTAIRRNVEFGSPDASFTITMVTNPYCGPCADMHERLEAFLSQNGDNINLQIIYATNHTSQGDRAVKTLIGIYQQYNKDAAEEIYAQWYKGGKENIDSFLQKYPVNTEDSGVLEAFEEHRSWSDESGIKATPMIYVNGYHLPNWYEIEDLRHFVRK